MSIQNSSLSLSQHIPKADLVKKSPERPEIVYSKDEILKGQIGISVIKSEIKEENGIKDQIAIIFSFKPDQDPKTLDDAFDKAAERFKENASERSKGNSPKTLSLYDIHCKDCESEKTIGEKSREALEKSKQKIGEGVEKSKDALHRGKEKIGEKMEEAGKNLQNHHSVSHFSFLS
jgi:hypothetical protein